jgi:hypothetical protein
MSIDLRYELIDERVKFLSGKMVKSLQLFTMGYLKMGLSMMIQEAGYDPDLIDWNGLKW